MDVFHSPVFTAIVTVVVCCGIAESNASPHQLIASEQFVIRELESDAVHYGAIRTMTMASRWRCAAACSKEKSCRSFSFMARTRRCELMDVTVVSSASDDVPYRSFERRGKNCLQFVEFLHKHARGTTHDKHDDN